MSTFRSLRILLLALVVSLIPLKSFGGVFISVNFAPPVLPVYVQPPCPEPGLMWVPGYWAYGDDGYYWVPGTWVPAPYEGALWTPPYWGWEGGLYVFHPGYWGEHVGYYGGVNYGFGYMGVGFVGGLWRGHDFVYNTAVVHVDDRYVRNVYVDREIVQRNTIVNDRHIAFSGGRDGIHHDPLPEERFADRDRHVTETNFQQSHENAARSDHSSYARSNGGHPNNVVMQRPMGPGSNSMRGNGGGFSGRDNGSQQPQYQQPQNRQPQYQQPQNQQPQNQQPQNQQPQYRGNAGNPTSNVRPYDNRNTYNPPPNSGNQGRNNNSPQSGYQSPQYRNNTPPPQNNPAPQSRSYNNSHGSQDNMQNRGGPPPQQQQQQSQPQQHGDQGGHGVHGDHGHDHNH